MQGEEHPAGEEQAKPSTAYVHRASDLVEAFDPDGMPVTAIACLGGGHIRAVERSKGAASQTTQLPHCSRARE